MTILFLTLSGRNGASSRYRVYQYIPSFEDAGYSVTVMPPAAKKGRGLGRLIKGLTEESACLKAARKADIVFVQKRLLSAGFLRKMRRTCRKIIFDFDDSIFTSPKGDWSGLTKKKVLERLHTSFAVSDMVIAGNDFLKDYASANGAKLVQVIPTAIDMTRYPAKQPTSGEKIVLGWIGSSVNHVYLKMLEGILPGLSVEYPGLELLVVSDKDFAMDGVNVINRIWAEETEVSDLMKMDIGLMPLADNEWTRGKCALKALQYMACGIPAVCSRAGANKEVIRDGVDGFLAGDAGEWLAALRGLMSSPDRRAEVGQAGRCKVQARYSTSVLAPTYVRLLASL